MMSSEKKFLELMDEYGYMVAWYENNGCEVNPASDLIEKVYFVVLKKPYGIEDGPDYYADHICGFANELERYFSRVEKIDPAVWDNGGVPLDK